MSMEVRKESNGLKNSMVTREELAIINQFTKRALKEDEVYTFAVRLCDNEVDRDGERFPRATLEELMTLPRIGEKLAQRILDYRAQYGRFSAPEQLMDVEGIGEGTFEGLRELVTVEDSK